MWMSPCSVATADSVTESRDACRAEALAALATPKSSWPCRCWCMQPCLSPRQNRQWMSLRDTLSLTSDMFYIVSLWTFLQTVLDLQPPHASIWIEVSPPRCFSFYAPFPNSSFISPADKSDNMLLYYCPQPPSSNLPRQCGAWLDSPTPYLSSFESDYKWSIWK